MGLLILFAFAAAWIVAIGTLALIHHMRHPFRKTFAVAMARGKPTDPRELGLAAREVTFRFDDGETSPGWIIEGKKSESAAFTGDASRSPGPTIVLTHGLNDSRFGALKRVPSLVPFASRVVIYDLRGHGDSTAKVTTLTAKEPDDLIAVMNQVDDGTPFVLVGHSMGAGIAIVAAAKEEKEAGDRGQGTGDRGQGTGDRGQGTGDRGRGTGDRRQGTGDREQGTEDRGRETRDRTGRSELRPQQPRLRIQNPELSDPQPPTPNPQPPTPNPQPPTPNPQPLSPSRVIGVIAEAGYRYGMEPVAGYLWRKRIPPWPFTWLAGRHFAFWLDLSKRKFDRTRHAALLSCPLWLLHGMKDDLCPLGSAQLVAAAAPRGRLVAFEGCDHGCLALQDEARYTQTLREFFAEIEAGRKG